MVHLPLQMVHVKRFKVIAFFALENFIVVELASTSLYAAYSIALPELFQK